MKKQICLHSLLLIILYSFNYTSAQSLNEKNAWLAGALLKIQKNISRYDDKIEVYKKEILKCDNNISNLEKLITTARERNNAEAEKTARDALGKTYNAKEKNTSLLAYTKTLRLQSESILLSVKEKLFGNSGLIQAVTLKYSGDIGMMKANGEYIKFNSSDTPILENGDMVSTSESGKIDMQFLSGRGNLSISGNSGLKFSGSDTLDRVDLLKGKVRFAVKKGEEFEKELKAEYEDYKKTIKSLPESFEDYLKKYKVRLAKKFEVRTASGSGAVRGTEFIVNNTDGHITEITVLDGSVEMTSLDGSDSAVIKSGYRGIITEKGKIIVEIIDAAKIDKWWDED